MGKLHFYMCSLFISISLQPILQTIFNAVTGGQCATAGMLPPSDSDEEEEEMPAAKPKGQVSERDADTGGPLTVNSRHVADRHHSLPKHA